VVHRAKAEFAQAVQQCLSLHRVRDREPTSIRSPSRRAFDYRRVYDAMRHIYPRRAASPAPGFAAGTVLVKDTMRKPGGIRAEPVQPRQPAMLVNEGLVLPHLQ